MPNVMVHAPVLCNDVVALCLHVLLTLSGAMHGHTDCTNNLRLREQQRP